MTPQPEDFPPSSAPAWSSLETVACRHQLTLPKKPGPSQEDGSHGGTHCLLPAASPHTLSLTSLRCAGSGVQPGRTGQGEATVQLQHYVLRGLGQNTSPSASASPLEDKYGGGPTLQQCYEGQKRELEALCECCHNCHHSRSCSLVLIISNDSHL